MRSSLIRRVASTIHRYNMLPSGGPLGVAVSGGADSMFLLHALAELAAEARQRLVVVHLDHAMRADSTADARFVADQAAALRLPCHVRRVGVAALGGNLENAARQARLAFFRALTSGRAAARVATGHTRDDQAETVLLRLLRGSGPAGLAGILPVTDEGLVRPLLGISREELAAWLRERGIPWRDDPTNADLTYDRNRVRHALLPQLGCEWNPQLADRLATLAAVAYDEEAHWRGQVAAVAARLIRREPDGALILRADALLAEPVALQRRLVRHAAALLKDAGPGLDFAHVQAVLALAADPASHGRVQVPGLDALRSFELLRLARSGPSGERGWTQRIDLPAVAAIPALGLRLRFALGEHAADKDYTEGCWRLDAVLASSPLLLRGWQPGDRLRPVSAATPRLVKEWFQDARVPLWQRRHWPVLTAGERVLWVWQLGVDAAVAPGGTGPSVLIQTGWLNQEAPAARL